MATIDPNIAMGYRPVQIENPMNQLAAYSQIQGAQQGQQMNALKMRQAQQEFDTQNRLGKAWQSSINRDTGEIDYNSLLKNLSTDEIGATAIPGVIKSRKEAALAEQQLKTQQATEAKNVAETKNTVLKNIREKTSDLQFNPYDDNVKAHAQDAILHGVWTPEQAAQNVAEALAIPIAQRPAYFAKKGLDAEKRVTTEETARANAERERNARRQTDISGGQLNLAERRLAADLNPELIRSKAENIRLGTLAAEQSPLAPKVIAADAGKNLVGDVATQMGNSYLKLYESSGIKSTTRGAAANLAASSQSSMLGQIGGGILGTENQSERDFIKSQRPILVQGIVKATGMTASQINSNVELKNLLDAATDPDKGYETNAKNLNLINKRFGTGTNIMPEKPNAATQSGVNTVTTSDGKTYTFPTPAAAAQFKQAAGIK